MPMKRSNFPQIRVIGIVIATLVPVLLLSFAWSAMADQSTPSRALIAVEFEPAAPPSAPVPTAQPPAPAVAAAQSSAPAPSIVPASGASIAAVPCNSVVVYDTRGPGSGAWNDYNCVDHSVFLTNSLTFREVVDTVVVTPGLDLSLAVPLVMSDGFGVSMNVFAGLFSGAPPNTCVAGSENKQLTMYRHAIIPNAPVGVYTTVVDSDNMDGFLHVIVACGSPNSGWCATPAAARANIVCSNYTISDTTEGGPDNITLYDARYWLDEYAYDGPERVYRIVLTQTVVFTFTLHYSGSQTLLYNNYMSYFLLDNTCNQHQVWDNPAPPEHLLIGEGTFTETVTQTHGVHTMGPGTYYLVVDGMHLPYQGDSFLLDVQCTRPKTVYLPLVLRNYPPIPTVTANPALGPSGTEFSFTGTGFTPNETVSHWFTEPNGTPHNQPNFTAGSQGGFLVKLTLTGPWPPGTYTYYARGAQSQHTASVNFQITP
jgi:hypothetical protein